MTVVTPNQLFSHNVNRGTFFLALLHQRQHINTIKEEADTLR